MVTKESLIDEPQGSNDVDEKNDPTRFLSRFHSLHTFPFHVSGFITLFSFPSDRCDVPFSQIIVSGRKKSNGGKATGIWKVFVDAFHARTIPKWEIFCSRRHGRRRFSSAC